MPKSDNIELEGVVVEALPNARKISFKVTLDDGSTHEPVFEVGGYDETTIGNPSRPAN